MNNPRPPKTQKQIDALRRKVWNKDSVKNPIAKELLQGDGRLGAKVNDKTSYQRRQEKLLVRKEIEKEIDTNEPSES